MKSRFQLVAALSVTGLVALACGGGGGGTTTGGTDTSKGEIIIASDFPASGGEASTGIPEEQGVDYAITRAGGAIKGFKLTHKKYDDAVNGTHDPQKGAQNAQDMVSNPKILAMVGPNNSNVARAIIPILNDAEMAMISPANTNECLTQSFPYCNPQPSALRRGKPNNYFRLAAADTFQGPAMADYAIDVLKVTKVAVWSDNETFGKGVADNFAKQFVKRGGTVVKRADFDWKNTNDFKTFINDAKNAGAQAIYTGSTTGTKGCVFRAQMKGILDVPYLGPDGITQDPQCVKDAGDNAGNIYGTVAAADATQSTDQTVKEIVAGYKKIYPKDSDITSYTFASYDCAAILIDAIGRAIDANGGKIPSRAQIRDQVAKTKDFKGLTGTYTFDQNGDPTKPTMAIYKTDPTKPPDAAWVFVKQFGVGGNT